MDAAVSIRARVANQNVLALDAGRTYFRRTQPIFGIFPDCCQLSADQKASAPSYEFIEATI
jgi:hypothetical protein